MTDQRLPLVTARLVLRPFSPSDAKRVQELVSDPDVARPTLIIPCPFPAGAAEHWIAANAGARDAGTEVALAVTLRTDATLVGAVTLRNISQDHARAELGYWIGKPHWHLGYCTEAGHAIIRYGFEVLGLNRIHAVHAVWNPASGRVLEKLGMIREGVQRQHVRCRGVFEDIVLYGLLLSERDPGSQELTGGNRE